MHRHVLTRLVYTSAVLALAATSAPLHLQAGSELERHLRDQYNGKTLLLRNFYSGDSLRYEASGQLSRAATPGDWTVDGVVRVEDVKVSGHGLTIRAERAHLGWVRDVGFSPVQDVKDKADKQQTRSLRIEVDLGRATAEAADAALSQIFLTPNDNFAELVPDYWKPCVFAASTSKSTSEYNGCRFSPEFLATPGIVSSPDQTPQSGQAGDGVAELSNHPVPRLGKGITPPKAVSAPNPPFSEEARSAKYQGTTLLAIAVGKTGQVRRIRIVRPLGMGLDQKAVEAVSTWQFRPATKDGEPIDVEVQVEVDFHLY